MIKGAWTKGLAWLIFLILITSVEAVTLEELRADSRLTPDRFLRLFRNFHYAYRDVIQTPDVFLFTEAGDCDDFATLADLILSEKGYTTRLISVRMPGLNHVVCYVLEIKGYVDFNNRGFLLKRTVKCGDGIDEIAEKVARSFQSDWTSASEFTYKNRSKYLVKTMVKANKYNEK